MATAPRIIIDAGHGGSERAGNSSAYGARGPRGVVEKDVTLDIAKHVVARLGGAAALTRTRDRNLTIGARAARGQRSDIFVSIHANYGAPELSGPEVYVHPEAGRGSRALAGRIARALDHQAARYGGGADERRAAMAVLNPSTIGPTAACLVEVDYLSNPRGEQRLGDPGERAAIGAAIASAIQQHLASGLTWDLAAAIARILPEIQRSSMPERQKNRLRDLFTILRDNPSADDRYVNGFNSLLPTIGPRLNDQQFDAVLNRVTSDLQTELGWDRPGEMPLALLDDRIMRGIHYLNRRWATDGAAMSAGLLQLKDWAAERQHDRNSIYHAYGDLQDRYEGRYGEQLEPSSSRAIDSGSLTLQPGIPGHAPLLLSSAHNGGTLGLEGTITWNAGGRPRAITARFTDLASQGIASTQCAVRSPADLDVAIPITGAGNEPLRWQVPMNPGPARIELMMDSTDPQTRVRIDWRVVVSPPSLVPPSPIPLQPQPIPLHAYGQQNATRPLTIRGREHGRVLIQVPHQQPPDARTLVFRGTADLRAGGGLRLGASLEDPSARDPIPRVTYVDLDPYNPTPFSFSWPCRNLLTPGVYEVVLRVDGANDGTHVVVDHNHTIA